MPLNQSSTSSEESQVTFWFKTPTQAADKPKPSVVKLYNRIDWAWEYGKRSEYTIQALLGFIAISY